MCPSFLKSSMPLRSIPQSLNLPNPIFLDIFILIQGSFPPLFQEFGIRIFRPNTLMQSSLHVTSKSSFCSFPILADIDDVLVHGMIKQESETRSIAAVGKLFLETFDIQTFRPFFAKPDTPVEVYFYICVGRVREETNCLLIPVS